MKNFIFFLILLAHVLCFADEITDAVDKAVKEAEELKERMGTVSPEIDPKAEKEAEQAAKQFNSPEMQRRIDNAFKEFRESFPETAVKPETEQRIPFDCNSERIYIFVSSSMPEQLLRTYAADADRIGDPGIAFILNGIPGKEMKDAVSFVSSILIIDKRKCRKDDCDTYKAGFEINPMLFRKFAVTGVPCVVYERSTSGVISSSECQECQQGLTGTTQAFKISGAADLEYIFERLYEASKSGSILTLLDKLRGGEK